jgi:hypothetical protein
MNIITLLLGATLCVTAAHGGQPVIVEDVLTNGPQTGQKRTITKTLVSPKEASIPQQDTFVALNVQGQKINVPVHLTAFRHECTATRGTNSTSFICYEFQVLAKGDGGLVWSCWTPDFSRPHNFQVLTVESGTSYASYIREGVHLFHLSESREPVAMRRQFWDAPEDFEINHPDALPLLKMELLGEVLGETNMEGMGPQTWNLTVDNLSDKTGELRVTVHGAMAQPQCIFALRKGKWEILSTSTK